MGRTDGGAVSDPFHVPMTQQKTWRAGRFWWDCASPVGADVYPLRAVVFDLDALADIECEGHRVVYNAAFAAHGLDFEWSLARYRQLLALSDERQRVSAELRKRSVFTESDVLTQLLADEIYATKTMMFDEMILDADLAPRPGLVDLVMDAFYRRRLGRHRHRWPAKLGRAVGATTGRRRGRRNGGHRRRRQEAHAGSRGLSNRTVGTRDTRGECARSHRFGFRAAGGDLHGSGHRGHHR